MLAQTPQVFRFDLLKRAFEAARADGFTGTDESSLVERLEEVEVSVVLGSDRNIKITKPGDMELARLFLRARSRPASANLERSTAPAWAGMCTALAPGRPLILGGVTIPCEFGLEGHSDADILAHAITDALAGRGRAGRHRHALSRIPIRAGRAPTACCFCGTRASLCAAAGYAHCERRLDGDSRTAQAEGLPARRFASRWRATLGLALDRVSVKFKTAEGVGPVGEGRSAEAQAVVTLERKTSSES